MFSALDLLEPRSQHKATACSFPEGSDMRCDGESHYRQEFGPECCGRFLDTGECCSEPEMRWHEERVGSCPRAESHGRSDVHAERAAAAS